MLHHMRTRLIFMLGVGSLMAACTMAPGLVSVATTQRAAPTPVHLPIVVQKGEPADVDPPDLDPAQDECGPDDGIATQLTPTPVPPPGWIAPLTAEGAYNGRISPDSRYLVYLRGHADDDPCTGASVYLYSVSLDGGKPVQLTEKALASTSYRFEISADSRSVIYYAGFGGLTGLYRVPITGGAAIRLTADIIHDFQLSADGRWVVYWAQQDGGDGLYSVPIEGGKPVALGSQLSTSTYQISPDSRHVVYVVSKHTDNGINDLYSVPIDGGTPIHLNPGISLTNLLIPLNIVSPDSHSVLFIGRVEEHPAVLHAVPISGGTPVRLSAWDDLVNSSWTFSPDGRHVVFPAIRYVENKQYNGLLSAPVAGGDSVLLVESFLPDPIRPWQVAVTDERVIYRIEENRETTALYTAPITGGPRRQLFPDIAHPDDRLERFQLNADGSWLVYAAVDGAGATTLYGQPATGGNAVALTSAAGASLYQLAISPDERWIVYSVGRNLENNAFPLMDGLHLLSSEGGEPAPIPSTQGGNLLISFHFTPDGRYLWFEGDPDGNRHYAYYFLSTAGWGTETMGESLLFPLFLPEVAR